ncbi:MAG TPA: hypothetical protein GX693_05480 [Firmicutes bacterium]|nr:hypothetical protein [Bacillota bacterium]
MRDGILLLAAPWAWLLGRKLVDLYRQRGILKLNYRGAAITPALGPVLLIGYLPALGLAGWLDHSRAPQVLAVAMVLLGASWFGLWDDLLADPVSGFKGHFGALLKGEVTAGLLKIATAGMVGTIFAATLPCSLREKILAMLLIALSANGLNLLDRRPGRALKAFFLGSWALISFAGPGKVLWLLMPLQLVALVVAPLDLRARAMLGDCGSNLLGAALGVTSVFYLTVPSQLAMVLLWLAVHIYAEISSISLLIERYPLLKYLDRLGCCKE